MLIVIGASGGLGSGLAHHFTTADTSLGRVRRLSRPDIDLTDPASVNRPIAEAVETLEPNEPLHIINAAGVSVNAMLHKARNEDWESIMDVNLKSNFYILRALRNSGVSGKDVSLTVFGSVVQEIGVAGTLAYSASKSGLHGLVRTATQELSGHGIRINCIDLGYFDEGMIKQVPKVALASVVDSIPLRRLGTVQDLVQACFFVCTCTYLTGAIIKLNGGLT